MKAYSSWALPSTLHVLVLLQCLLTVHSATIPAISRRTPAALFSRTVTFGDTNEAKSASAKCSPDQVGILEASMPEAAALAKAGSDGFDIILDMLTDEKTKYKALDRKDQVRIRNTYFTFFGKIHKKDEFDTHKSRIGFMKDRIDRLKDLTKESWPSDITFFCDDTYYQDQDPDGKTKDQVSPPKDVTPGKNQEWKYDYDHKIWGQRYTALTCHGDGSQLAAFTLKNPPDNRDRITFCPEWFNVVKAKGKTLSEIDQDKDIAKDMAMAEFARRSARIFYHEHLHTFFVNQAKDDGNMLQDVEGGKSYTALKAKDYGSTNQDFAAKNIENVVYWSIAMYFNKWDWSTVTAQVPSADEPK